MFLEDRAPLKLRNANNVAGHYCVVKCEIIPSYASEKHFNLGVYTNSYARNYTSSRTAATSTAEQRFLESANTNMMTNLK